MEIEIDLWQQSTLHLLPKSTLSYLLLCLALGANSCNCLLAWYRWRQPPVSFSTFLLLLCSEFCLESSYQGLCLLYFIFRHQCDTPLYPIVQYSIDIFFANDITDLLFLLVICCYYLWRLFRVIQIRFHQ
jgi:hypothetical protein